ncbi:MAG: aspartate aminotransferase family protein [Pseudomonadota bacterium]
MAQHEIPAEGWSHQRVLDEMRSYGAQDVDYRAARTFSLVYWLGDEHTDFLKQAHGMYFSENGLNPMAFKSLRRFENEVVRMAADMLHGDAQVVGTMTTGGTESCLLAVKTARDRYRSRLLPGMRRPEVVMPESAHVAFRKGCHYFGLKQVTVPVGKDLRVDLKALKRRLSSRTALVVASAPGYPHGVVDPIEEIAALTRSRGIPLHVDACLGGFLLPWVEKLGYPVPTFDFRVPGVTSMSADIHKYGYAAKGASLILHRDISYLRHQFNAIVDWSGGVYVSPTLMGTRPGGAIGAAWATLKAIGQDGYLERTRGLMETTRRFREGIASIAGLEVLGNPVMSVMAFCSRDPDLYIYAVADEMDRRGWNIDRLQKPEALHVMLTPLHATVVDTWLADLREAVSLVRGHPELAETGSAAMYGMVSKIPVKRLVEGSVIDMMADMYGPDGGNLDPAAAAGSDDLVNRLGLAFTRMRRKVERRLGR